MLLSDSDELRAPSFTLGKRKELAWKFVRQWGACWGRKGDSQGRRLGWMGGMRSGTQSLAEKLQQMAAEQQGCREALRLLSEWLSGKKKRSENGQREKGHQVWVKSWKVTEYTVIRRSVFSNRWLELNSCAILILLECYQEHDKLWH